MSPKKKYMRTGSSAEGGTDVLPPSTNAVLLPVNYHERTFREMRARFLKLEWRLDQLEAERRHRRMIMRARDMPLGDMLQKHMEDLFYFWYFSTNPEERDDTLEIPHLDIHSLNREWFAPLVDPVGCLKFVHVDAMMNVHAYETRKLLGTWLEEWTFFETTCWVVLSKPQSEYRTVEAFMRPYAMGLKPVAAGLPWDDANRIYGVGHVGVDEWVLYEICFESQVITVFTSACMTAGAQWNALQAKFQNMALHLPALMHSLSLSTEEINPVWSILRSSEMPHINVNADSGILAIQAFRVITDGGSIKDIKADMVVDYRMQYCTELYKLGLYENST